MHIIPFEDKYYWRIKMAQKISKELRIAIISEMSATHSAADIAKKLGVLRATLLSQAKSYGIELVFEQKIRKNNYIKNRSASVVEHHIEVIGAKANHKTIAELADICEISSQYVIKLADKNGIVLARENEYQLIKEFAQAGKTVNEISQSLKLSQSVIYKIAKSHNLKLETDELIENGWDVEIARSMFLIEKKSILNIFKHFGINKAKKKYREQAKSEIYSAVMNMVFK